VGIAVDEAKGMLALLASHLASPTLSHQGTTLRAFPQTGVSSERFRISKALEKRGIHKGLQG